MSRKHDPALPHPRETQLLAVTGAMQVFNKFMVTNRRQPLSLTAFKDWTDKGRIPHIKDSAGRRLYQLSDILDVVKKLGKAPRKRDSSPNTNEAADE